MRIKNKLFIFFTSSLMLITTLIYFTSAGTVFKWPLNLPKYLTATLGETRGSYLHHGIDIKTNGRTGYPVFASAPGKLKRIVSKDAGYGNAMFIDHGNDIQTVYGHLEKFEQKKYHLADVSKVLKVLYNTNNLNFNFHSDRYLFEKDEMIAEAGESGSGLPHLHFEIREKDKYPNPLDYIHIKDRNPPAIECLYLCVERKNTTVYEEKINVRKRFWGYRTDDPVKISTSGNDKIFFKISCYDKIGTYNKLAVYRIKVYEDKEKIFELAFDSLGSEDIQMGHLIYDGSKSSIKHGTSYIYNLCRKEDNYFNGYKTKGNGYINPGKHPEDIKIQVSDFAGNEITLKFSLETGNSNFNYAEDFSEISAGKSNKIYNRNNNIKFTIPEGAVNLDSLIKIEDSVDPGIIENLCKDNNLNETDILNIFSIYPHDSFYNRPTKITVKYTGKIPDKDVVRVSVYQFYEGKRPVLLKTDYSSFLNTFRAETFRNGYFALIRDNKPPDISIPPTFQFCADEEIYRKLRFFITDNLSRVNDESIHCYIDGEIFPVIFDADRDWAEVVLVRNIISEGIHHVMIKVEDNANNMSVFRDLILF